MTAFAHAPVVPAARPLAGRAALVTGAGRGLGAAISRRLDQAGARVALVGRDRGTLEDLAAELEQDPVVLPADLAEPEAPYATLTAAIERLGRLDVLVNNAGRAHGAAAHELDAAEVDAVLALNVRAPLLLAGAAAERMARAGGGSIINISSALAGLGIPHNSVYAASKGAVEGATRALAAEWGPRGVRVNAVRPAVTRSDMSAPLLADEAVVAAYLRRVPLGSVGEAEDVAAAVRFLASDEAAYVTGQTIDVDGGWGATAPSIFATD